jgi:tRNA pseudouridine65 synthase
MKPPLSILHQDDHLVVVSKPSGMVVHRSELVNDRDNCMRRVRGQVGRHVWPVHRLDRGASGALVFALDPTSARVLQEALAARDAEKRYLAVVRGWPAESGSIERPLDCEGKVLEAHTRYARKATSEIPLRTGPRHPTSRFALVEVELLTGRLHQIRRHLAGAGWPIVGDRGHGDLKQSRLLAEQLGIGRLLLHAARISLPHPAGGRLTVECPLPDDMARAMAALGLAA